MTVATIAVGLNIKDEQLRAEFETILASQPEFRLKKSDDPRPPHLLILEMDEDRTKTFGLINSILAASPFTEIFLTAPRTEPEVLLEALRAGVKEFIPQPIQRAELEDAFNRFKERHKDRPPETTKRGKLINIIGSKGGVGATTIAVNLATSLLQSQENKSVVLVDMNPQFGDAALFLDIEPVHTLGDIAKNIERLDETFLRSILSQHPFGLYLLPSVNTVEEIGSLTAESAEKTLALLQESFDYIIVDSGDSLADTTLAVLNMSPTLLLVSTLTVPALRSTRRLFDIFSHVGYSRENVEIIINRFQKRTEVSLKDMEDLLGKEVFWKIPNDYFSTMEAINKGQPLSVTARRAEITKSFHKLAAILSADEKEHYTSFFGRLFRSN
jgi:pilus assembly protein CpaE